MRKYIITGLLIVAVALGLGLRIQYANAGLYDCFKSSGIEWMSVEDRAPIAAQWGIWQYRGTAEQNTLLESYLCPEDKGDGMLGYSVVTGFQKTLRSTMNSTQSTVPVSSLTLKDGEVLTMAMLGDNVFLTLEPGKNKEEIVMCSGITASPAQFTGCTRGLAFSGATTTAVAANKYSHGAGSTVVISNVHYVYEELTDTDTDQTTSGDWTNSGVWTFTSTSPNVYYTFPLVSTTAYTGLPTNNGDLATKYYVDTVGAGGFTAVNASTTKGLEVYGTSPETVGINASSTLGMTFDNDGALYQAIGNALEYTGNAIAVNTSTIVSQIATSTPTASLIPIADGSGKLGSGWIPSKYLGSGSDGALNLVSTTQAIDLGNASLVLKEYTSINIDASSTLSFTNASTTGSVIILKSQGTCTITGTINGSGTGGDKGTGETGGTSNSTDGKSGTASLYYSDYGLRGLTDGGVVGVGGEASLIDLINSTITGNNTYQFVVIGAGGGGGSGAGPGAAGGAGGDGAGALIITCNELNFTGTVTMDGSDGVNGTGGSGQGAGGGGGGGGSFVAIYNNLTASSGTITVTGGTGGTAGIGSGTAYGGGGGGSATAGANGTSSAINGTKTGGNGGNGFYKIIKNNMFF